MADLPLKGLRVLEFTHVIMGPCAGLLLADMGAEVIRIEPLEGDPSRRYQGFGAGIYGMYNRNKKSLAVDIKTDEGKKLIYDLVPTVDILIENFGPGTIDRLGFGYEQLKALNDRLIYCSLKGFLDGPYEKRLAMDEVVQMMGGLAYMTGRAGDPIRAGTSIVDITGGMFGHIGILLALYEREKTGTGKYVKTALFETCAFLMGQHMAYASQIDHPVPPMPSRVNVWSVYRTFETQDEDSVFIGIISEKHWRRFCEAFAWQDWLQDERLGTNEGRLAESSWFLPALENRLRKFTKQLIIQTCEKAAVPFAPISTPEDLFEDPQLNQGGSLLPVNMPNGTATKLPKIPLDYDGAAIKKRIDPPKIGDHTIEVLRSIDYSPEAIDRMIAQGIIK